MFSFHRISTFLLLIVILSMLTTASWAKQPAAAGPALNVNAASGRRAISPYIYGMNFADQALAQELRLLDYFDLHYYPQTTDVALKPAGDAERQARRLRSVRGLWDPTYVD